MRPIIGITLNTRPTLIGHYATSVARAGGSPLLLSTVPQIEDLDPVLQNLDGLIFSGGTDISPHLYNEYPKQGLGEIKPQRDAFEMALMDHCFKQYTFPILGICRGFQLLNVYHGGTLYQALEHKEPQGIKHWLMDTYPFEFPAHDTTVNTESRLYEILQKNCLQVNSLHHQGVYEVGKGLKAMGHAPDGIVEVLEKEGERFVLGVQWHPELMTETCPHALQLFKGFVAACSTPATVPSP